MDKRLQILQALYAEGDDREQAHRLLQEDPALWEEYQALSEAKFHLDHRRRQRPDPLVLDAILAAASGEAPAVGLGRRPDRRPIPRGALRFRSFGVVTVVLVMVMLAGAGVWQVLQPNGSPLPDVPAREHVLSEAAPTAAPPPAVAVPDAVISDTPLPEALPAQALTAVAPVPAPDPGSVAPAKPSAAVAARAAVPEADEETLDWDASDEVRELRRRVAMLEAGVEQNWDTPALPLEQLPSVPSGTSGSRFRQVGRQQPHP